ncbi:MAG: hypothetical protein ACWGOY_12215, partial [Anaerolineales bacterium]
PFGIFKTIVILNFCVGYILTNRRIITQLGGNTIEMSYSITLLIFGNSVLYRLINGILSWFFV